MNKFLYIFMLFHLSFAFNETIYKDTYLIYKNKYQPHINIKEISRLKSQGFFYYTVKNGEICDYSENILINKTTYKSMLPILIHELTHYLQCIYSNKNNKNITSIKNHVLPLHTIQFIENAYDKKHWNMEYEAFYYQDNINEFHKLENLLYF